MKSLLVLVLILPSWGFAALNNKRDFNKAAMRILNDRPFNAESYVHQLDVDPTPTAFFFVRNNGIVPEIAFQKNVGSWTLTIDGEVEKPLKLTMKDFAKYKTYKYQLVLECGGNGRAGYYPPTKGNQWTMGAVGCPMWEGVLLKDVLATAKVKKSAVFLAYYGHDVHPSGDRSKNPISRGVPIAKALHDKTMIAFKMNGKPLPAVHGFPARLVVPGYPGSTSGKWLKRLWVRDRIHDGAKMTGDSYRMPEYPVAPGEDAKEMKIIEQMPVKSLITHPRSGQEFKYAGTFNCRGFAWTGDPQGIKKVDVSFDYGQTWVKAKLHNPRNQFAWQKWEAKLKIPKPGYYEIWARAQEASGRMQPVIVPGWNPKGYLNNASPRISARFI